MVAIGKVYPQELGYELLLSQDELDILAELLAAKHTVFDLSIIHDLGRMKLVDSLYKALLPHKTGKVLASSPAE